MNKNLLRVILWPALFCGLISCQQQQADVSDIDTIRAVKVYTVLDAATAAERTFPGKSSSSTSSILSFPVSGRISELSIATGDSVNKGQAIAKLDDTSFMLDQKVAQAEYMKAKAIYSEKKNDYDRKASLLKKGWITRTDVDQSASAMKSALQQMNLTRTKISLAKNKVLDTILTAPFSGVIAERSIALHEEVSAGQQVVLMEGLDSIDVKIDVPEKVVSKLAIGQSTHVRFNAFEEVLSARITEIGSSAEAGNTFTVKVSLLDIPDGLKSGMSAEVTLNIGQATDEQHYLIPLSSVIAGDNNSKAYIYIFDPDTLLVNKRAVTPAQRSTVNSFLAVTGVNAGEQIVSAGVSFLSDGLKVKRYQVQ